MTDSFAHSLADFGGALTNYKIGVIDPTTDPDADKRNQGTASAAMMTRTATRASVVFQFATATTLEIVEHEALWKGATKTPPTVARVGTGHFTIDYPATIVDELGAVHTLDFGRAKASVSPARFVVWSALRASAVGDLIAPTIANGYVYRCTVAGTRGGSEPSWATTLGNTFADGGVTWRCEAKSPDAAAKAQGVVTGPHTVDVYTFSAWTLTDLFGCSVDVQVKP